MPSLPRSNVGGWYQRPTCSTGVAAAGLADRAKEAKQASHFDGRCPALFEWTVKMWENVPPPPAR
ncbi:MAG: hypothetical protein EOO77_32930 [Oxalobacteraceae bacterium]|nr:MAG: hypothetical protein EOO77_32930 [Oxalobacteraceae bacterium]